MIKASPHWKDKPALAAALIGRLNSASDPTATVVSLIPNASDALSSTKNRRDCVCHHSAGHHLLEAEVWWNFEDVDGDLTERSCEGLKDCYESTLKFWGPTIPFPLFEQPKLWKCFRSAGVACRLLALLKLLCALLFAILGVRKQDK